MTTSANLAIPYLAPAQAQKHVTVNEALRKLDAIVQLSVVSATTTAQPASPTDGAVYILPAGKTGAAWGAMGNGALAHYRDGAWEAITPREGWLAYVRDTDALLVFDGTTWGAGFRVSVDNGSKTALAISSTEARINVSTAFLFGPSTFAPASFTNFGVVATPYTQLLAAGPEASLMVTRYGANANPARITLGKSRGAAVGQFATPAAGDIIGELLAVCSDGATTLRTTANIAFHVTGVPVANLNIPSRLVFNTTDALGAYAARWSVEDTAFQPWVDNAYSLGSSSRRLSQVWSTTGAIQTSDATEKTPLQPLGDALKRAAARIRAGIGVFQWLEAVAEKGADGARLHIGVTAQAVQAAFEAEGLDPWKYGLFCANPLTEQVEVEPAGADPISGEPVPARFEERPVLDATGAPKLRLGVRSDQLALLLASLDNPTSG